MPELIKIVQTWQDEDGTKTEKTFDYSDGNLVGESVSLVGVVLTQGVVAEVGAEPKAAIGDESPPIEPSPPTGKLPPDFPGHKALDEAGVHTYSQLAKYADDYTSLPGIGKATAEKIKECLG